MDTSKIDIQKVFMVLGAYYLGKKILGPMVYLALMGGAVYLTVQYKQTGKLPEVPQF
jgi:hypothetical protein